MRGICGDVRCLTRSAIRVTRRVTPGYTCMAFNAQNWLINRRHALKGLGVSLALPLLDCMRPLRAAEAKPRAKRSVFIYLPNGVNTAEFQMPTSGPDYKLSKPLQ